ncbi:hypothetical protein [Stenotrophomonas sp. PS02289]|uniref:hypothetical protein n=1 Tax=Stenotrophomonas sp. PS02289 TaxID=2991422 RepID=UPI00249BD438|nr:hypothetical protein [Stenotrophomonas sp. PS02289]
MFSLVVGIGILYWCLWVAAAFWVFYPTSLGSELKTFTPLSPEAYARVRSSAIEHSKTIAGKGIDINAGMDPAAPFAFYCNGVPLLLVDNGHIALTVNVMANADERAPSLKSFREEMLSQLVPEGRPLNAGQAIEQPAGLEAFVLKYRDGIDVSQQCR